MALTCLGVYWGLAAGGIGPALFFVWLLYIVFGGLIGIWADTSKIEF